MKKIGFVINNLGPSQLAFNVIKNSNELLKKDFLFDIIGFYENLEIPCIEPDFGTMNISEIFGFEGILIATDISTASKVINCPSIYQKFFYVNDLEWSRKQYDYNFLKEIFRSELKIIARSCSHKKIIEDAFNIRVVDISNDLSPGKYYEQEKK